MTPVSFPSDAWIAAVGEEAQRLVLEEAPPPSGKFTMIERYTNVPDARSDGLSDGYRLTFDGTTVTIKSGVSPDDTADFYVVADHHIVSKSLKMMAGPELDTMMEEASRSGEIVMTGSMEKAPMPMMLLHDAMVRRSA